MVIFSTTIKSINYPTKAEIIENAFLKEYVEHRHLGYNGFYNTIHSDKTKIVAYSNLTKQQYKNYKIKDPDLIITAN